MSVEKIPDTHWAPIDRMFHKPSSGCSGDVGFWAVVGVLFVLAVLV